MTETPPEVPPEVDAEALRAYLGASSTDAELAYLGECAEQAALLVDDALANAFRPMPAEIRRRCVMETGARLYKRRDEPAGSSQFVTSEGAVPVRGPADPLTPIRPILARYVIPL